MSTLSPGLNPAQPLDGSNPAGRKYEGIAFTFCKASTLALLGQLLLGPRYILPFIALGTAIWYGIALYHGQKTTRCLLRLPWIAIAFWLLIGSWYAWRAFSGAEAASALSLIQKLGGGV